MAKSISRRTMLRGLGVGIALPMLEAMLPRTPLLGAPAAAKAAQAPLRAAWLYVPNGMYMQDWTPNDVGPIKELPGLLQPFAEFKNQLTVVSNLAQHHARANGDGAEIMRAVWLLI